MPHSLSKEIHGAFGLDYSLVELADDLALCAFAKAREYDGFNVTIPYKEEIIKHLDGVDKEAAAIGAVNTVIKREGNLFGFNTDIGGMAFAFESAGIDVFGKTVMVLGSGGTSKTARRYAKKRGAKDIFTVSRSGEIDYRNCYDYPAEVLINTTPVGMAPHAGDSPVDLSRFQNLCAVFDAVYNPLNTRLLMQAKELGLTFSNGLNMLVEQARLARDMFTGTLSENSLTQKLCGKLFFERASIVLIGMAGCGKSAVGRAVAKELSRQFLDTDEIVQRKTGKSVPDIFAQLGEAEFRALERQAVKDAAEAPGAVIATGGGAPMSDENRAALNGNGVIVYITRPFENLDLTERPLYTDVLEVKRLFSAREPIYRKFCDIEIQNAGTVGDVAKKVISAVKRFVGYK